MVLGVAVSLAVDPDQAEVGLCRPVVRVGPIEHQDPLVVPGKAVCNGSAHYSGARNDHVVFTQHVQRPFFFGSMRRLRAVPAVPEPPGFSGAVKWIAWGEWK